MGRTTVRVMLKPEHCPFPLECGCWIDCERADFNPRTADGEILGESPVTQKPVKLFLGVDRFVWDGDVFAYVGPPPGTEVTLARALEVLSERHVARERGRAYTGDGFLLGTNPATGYWVVVRLQRELRGGPQIIEVASWPPGPEDTPEHVRSASLPQGTDWRSLSLDDALQLLTLPRSLGADPSTGEEIVAHLGRYGAYLERGERRSPLDSHEQALSITFEDAMAHLAIPDSVTEVVMDLGRDPGTDRTVVLERITYRSGKSHDVLTDGVTSVSSFNLGRLRRRLADLTASDAYRLLAEQRERDEKSPPRRHGP